MTDSTKKEFSSEANSENSIDADDPLFELSQIVGFDDDDASSAPSSADIDPQIDLEDALLAELAGPPEEPAAEMQPEREPEQNYPVEAAAPEFVPELETEAIAADDADAAGADEASQEPLEAFADPSAGPEIDISPETVADVEPTVEAQSVPSLEDELTAMLGAEVSIAQEAPAYGAEFEDAQQEAFEASEATFDVPSEPAEDIPSSVDESPSTFFEQPMDDELEAVQLKEAVQEDPAGAFDEDVAPIASAISESAPEAQPLEAAPTSAPEMDIDEVELEDDFSDFFQDELNRAAEEASEPAPAAEAGFEPAYQEAEATSDDVSPPENQLDEHLNTLFDPYQPTAEASEVNAAPQVETTDMSAFDGPDAVSIDVPDLPDLEDDFAKQFDREFDLDFTEDEGQDNVEYGAALAAAAGAAGVGLAAQGSSTATPDQYDAGDFEAELARDIEFAGHNSKPKQADADFEPEELNFTDQEFAAAAAANKPPTRGIVVATVLGFIAIIGAIGIFAFAGGSGEESAEPVLFSADETPIKVQPEEPGGTEVPNQDRAVFSENAAEPEQETLISSTEEPLDITAAPDASLPSVVADGDAQKAEDRLLPSEETTVAADNPAVVTPRRVRTLIVRPDGTLVEREAIPAPEPIETQAAAPEPVGTGETEIATAVPAQTGAEATVTPEPVVVPEPAATIDTQSAEVQTEAAPAQTPPADQTVPLRTVRTQVITPGTIADRPNDQPVNIVNPEQATQVAAAPTTPDPVVPTPAPAATTTPFAVQLASLPSQAEAQQSANLLSGRYGGILAGRGLSIQRAVIDGRGTFFRVRVGANDRAEANSICNSIKASGGDCFVTR